MTGATGKLTQRAQVELVMPARAEYVPAVRRVIAGVGAALDLPASMIGDVNLAVTEACTNVVRHAYDGEVGPMKLEIEPEEGSLGIVVRDAGRGIAPQPISLEPEPMGIGLPLMASLASNFQVRSEPEEGTSVVMRFDLVDIDLPDDVVGDTPRELDDTPGLLEATTPDGIAISIGPERLIEPVLERVIAVVAMRADFVIDRITDAQLVAGALAAHASARALDGRLAVVLSDSAREIDLSIGPLEPGGAERLLRASELPGVGRLLERIADDVRIERSPASGESSGELLRLQLQDRS